MTYSKIAAVLLGFTLSAGLSLAAPATQLTPYPLKTCLVSGEELGEMGEPRVIEYEGRQIKFCCGSCEKKFKADPAKYLKKLDATPTTKPAA